MSWIDKKTTTIRGRTMAWAEIGTGDPIVFLHGNPTSSYLWRNVMPHLENLGRCIAPDLAALVAADQQGIRKLHHRMVPAIKQARIAGEAGGKLAMLPLATRRERGRRGRLLLLLRRRRRLPLLVPVPVPKHRRLRLQGRQPRLPLLLSDGQDGGVPLVHGALLRRARPRLHHRNRAM